MEPNVFAPGAQGKCTHFGAWAKGRESGGGGGGGGGRSSSSSSSRCRRRPRPRRRRRIRGRRRGFIDLLVVATVMRLQCLYL